MLKAPTTFSHYQLTLIRSKQVNSNPEIPTVGEYMESQIKLSGRTQTEIARLAGFNKPNIITMFKQHKTPVPYHRVKALSEAMGVDPKRFLVVVLNQQSPELLSCLEDLVGDEIWKAK